MLAHAIYYRKVISYAACNPRVTKILIEQLDFFMDRPVQAKSNPRLAFTLPPVPVKPVYIPPNI